MPIIINFKICDNSPACDGIVACPTNALSWDKKKKSIKWDSKKCIGCGKCVKACTVSAINLAKTEAEAEKIKKMIAKDPRKLSDLFVDKYGAQVLDTSTLIKTKKAFNTKIADTKKLVVCEFFEDSGGQCLLRSIPIKDLFKHIDLLFYKVDVSNMSDLQAKYKVTKLPSLLFFKNGVLLGKIQGYYDLDHKEEFKAKIAKILKK